MVAIHLERKLSALVTLAFEQVLTVAELVADATEGTTTIFQFSVSP